MRFRSLSSGEGVCDASAPPFPLSCLKGGSMVRIIEEKDISSLVKMGAAFAAYAPYDAAYSPIKAETTLRYLLDTGSGAAFIDEDDSGAIRGFIIGAVVPIWYAEVILAVEMALWVQPEARGVRIAKELEEAFRGWAKDQGADYVTMSDLRIAGSYPFRLFFERAGYEEVERALIRRV